MKKLIILLLVSHLILESEIVHDILEFGPVQMALRAKERIPWFSHYYEFISNVSTITDRHKSLILLEFISEFARNITMFQDFKEFLSSDRRLEHLSIRMSRIG